MVGSGGVVAADPSLKLPVKLFEAAETLAVKGRSIELRAT